MFRERWLWRNPAISIEIDVMWSIGAVLTKVELYRNNFDQSQAEPG